MKNVHKEKFLRFEESGKSESGKTLIYDVISNVDDSYLGVIRWFARWRKYTFNPCTSTSFDYNCLLEITIFLAKLTDERKKKGE